MSQLVSEDKQAAIEKPIILIVDDAYANNLNRQKSITSNINLPGVSTKFVGSCEEAIETFKNETNIIFCFLDCMLPESKDNTSVYNPKEDAYIRGVNIIDNIIEINKEILIAIYSAYVGEPELKNRADRYENVIAHFKKEDLLKSIYTFVRETLERLGLSSNQLSQLEDNQQTGLEYNYDTLEPETRALVRQRTEQIKELVKRSTQDIIDIGRYLTDVKQNLKHGQFYPWLKSEFQWSLRTAARFMKVYDKFKSANLADLNLSPSVLYELSANTVPDAAIDETLELAESGETITIETAKLIKQKYQEKKKPELAKDDSIKAKIVVPGNTIKSTFDSNVNQTTNFRLARQGIFNREKPVVDSVKQNIVKVISSQKLWRVGKQEQHLILCLDPNSIRFMEQLPSEIALCLTFAPNRDWQWNGDRYKSLMNFYSEYQDLDPIGLFKSIQNILEITTGEQDNVVVCFIPHIKILSLIDALGCRAVVAEPNRRKCLELVEASKNL